MPDVHCNVEGCPDNYNHKCKAEKLEIAYQFIQNATPRQADVLCMTLHNHMKVDRKVARMVDKG